MTILHYVQRWLPLSEQFVHAQVSRSRHRAVVVSRHRPENLEAFPCRRLHSLAALERLPARARRAGVAAWALASRARLVHVHFGYCVHDALGAARRLRLPLVVSLHGHDATAFARAWPRHYDGVLDAAAAVVVPSRFLAEQVVQLGAPEEAVRILPSGVDRRWFSPTPLPPDPVVTFVGRFVEKKGIDVLVAAWPLVRQQVPEARLRLLGDGPMAEVASSAGAGVELVPPDPTRRAEQVRDELRRARVVVSPSRTAADGDAESLVVVNIEAQASGRPVVTSRHGGIPEFVDDGSSALLVAEGDARALADALAAVLTDDALATRLANAGPAVAARFDVDQCAARVDDLYDELATR